MESFKVLGQVNPGATILTDLYTVPALTKTVVSTIVVCNQSGATAFRISIAVAGAVDAPKQYLYYDIALAANNSFAATLGITLNAADVVRVYAGTATVSFNIFGTEIT